MRVDQEVDRADVVVCLVLMKNRGMTPEEAVAEFSRLKGK